MRKKSNIMLINTGIAPNMMLTINSFTWQNFFPHIFLTFGQFPDFSLTAVKFPDISRFSRKVVIV